MVVRVITFRCPDYVIEELDRMSLLLGVDRTTLLRYAVAELIKRFSKGEHLLKDNASWRVKRVVLSPPRDYVGDGAGVLSRRRPSCEEVVKAKEVLSWSGVADVFGFVSGHAAESWFRRNCLSRSKGWRA